MFVGVLFFAMSVVACVKKNGELTFYQVARVVSVEFSLPPSVRHMLRMNAYYQERNALSKCCHRRTRRKRIARKGMDLADFHRCKWT